MDKDKLEAMNALLVLKGTISEWPEEDQAKVKAATAELKEFVAKHDVHGLMSITMFCLQTSIDSE